MSWERVRLAAGVMRGMARLRFRPNVVVGARPSIVGSFNIIRRGKIEIGDRFFSEGFPSPVDLESHPGARLTVGDDVYAGSGVVINAQHRIEIGNNVMFAPHSCVLDDAQHEVEPGHKTFHGPTIIEDNVWVGRNAFITPGVRIGAGSVVAAGAIVTRDVPPNSLVGGTPAKVIRELNIPQGWVRQA